MEPIKHAITIDLAKANNLIPFYQIGQNDNNSHKFVFSIFNNSLIYDLTSLTARIYFTKEDTKDCYLDCVIDDAVNGKMSCLLTTQCLTCPGIVEGEITIYGTEGEILTSITFKFYVKKIVRNDSAIESTSDFSALTNALAQVTDFTNVKNEQVNARQGHANLLENLQAKDAQLADITYNLNGFTGATDQDKLTNAISFFNGASGTLLIAKNYTVTANMTIPKNLTVKFTQTGMLTVTHPAILQIDGNIDSGIHQIFSCTSGDILLPNLLQQAYPQWFGAKGDRITNDQNAVEGVIYSQCPVVRFPKGIYQAYLANGFSNRTFIFDEGSIIDGVVHLAVGAGPGVAPNPPTVTYVENIRVIGTLTCTVRVGSYYCRNVNVDKIHLLPTDSQYVNQTTEGGQKGNHFTSGTENLNIGEQLIEGTSNLTYALGIDIYAGDTVNLPKNITFGKVVINGCLTAGFAITKVQGLNIGEIYLNGYDQYNNNFADCDNVKIGKVYINGTTTTATTLFAFYANNVRNLTVDELVSEYNKYIGVYVLNCLNPTFNKITTNNNGNRGVFFYNNTNAYVGITLSHDNGAEGVYFKSPMTGKLIMSYNNASGNGIVFDTAANGCHDCKFEKAVAYNNKDINVAMYGTSNNIGEIVSYNPTGVGYAVSFLNSVLNKVKYIEVYGAAQGIRYNGCTNSFLDFIYAHDNTTGIALTGTNTGLYNRYIKYGGNTADVSGGTLAGISGYDGVTITT